VVNKTSRPRPSNPDDHKLRNIIVKSFDNSVDFPDLNAAKITPVSGPHTVKMKIIADG